MTRLSLHAEGSAGPGTVWERYADTRLWSTWSPQISRVELNGTHDRIATGLRGRVIAIGGIRVPFEVTDVDAGAMTWSWRVRLGPVAVRLDHGVEPLSGGARTTLDIDGLLPVVAAYAPLAQLALRRLVRR